MCMFDVWYDAFDNTNQYFKTVRRRFSSWVSCLRLQISYPWYQYPRSISTWESGSRLRSSAVPARSKDECIFLRRICRKWRKACTLILWWNLAYLRQSVGSMLGRVQYCIWRWKCCRMPWEFWWSYPTLKQLLSKNLSGFKEEQWSKSRDGRQLKQLKVFW